MVPENSGQIPVPSPVHPVLNGFVSNPVIKLLAGALVGLLLAYNSVVVTRTDNRIEALESGLERADDRLDALERDHAVHQEWHRGESDASDLRNEKWHATEKDRERRYEADRKVWLESLKGGQ